MQTRTVPKSFLIISQCLLLITLATPSFAAEPDWSDYSQLLQTHVQPGNKHDIALNLVNYHTLKTDKRWAETLTTLAGFDATQLTTQAEKLSFWINAYNILAIDMVLQHWPLQSIRDVGNFFSPVWKKPAGVVAGKMRTLHEIEHQILRPMGEPRIHFAIVCASVSCPDLRTTAYDASLLNAQLNQQARIFITHTDKGVRMQDGKLHVSKIFDWFEADFQTQGDVMTFIRQYRQNIPSQIQPTSYLDYDWSLNSMITTEIPD